MVQAPPNTFILAEHNEVVRIGGTSTACPSGRIPWTEILRRLEASAPPTPPTPAPVAEEEPVKHEAWATFFQGLEIGPGNRQGLNALADFSLPAGAKYVEVEFLVERGYGVVYNGDGSQAGRFGGPPAPVQTASFSAPIRIWPDGDGWWSIHAEDVKNPLKFFGAHAVARG